MEYLLVLSSVFGLAFLWIMTRIYVIPTIPPWNSWHTGLSFVSTAVCLGLITILFLHYIFGCVNCDEQFINDQTGKYLTVSLMIILLIEIISGFYHQTQLGRMNTGIDDLVLNKGAFYQVFLIRMVMLILALLTLFVLLFKPGLLAGKDYFLWIYPLLVLLIAQELTGRLLFYSSYFRIGV